MESCKPAIGQTNDKKQANNALRATGELLGHFPSKRKFVFKSKTFLTNDSRTPKRSNVQDNNDVTRQSLSSIPSIKLRGHPGKVFVKPSAVFVLLTLLLTFMAHSQKKNFRISFLLNVSILVHLTFNTTTTISPISQQF